MPLTNFCECHLIVGDQNATSGGNAGARPTTPVERPDILYWFDLFDDANFQAGESEQQRKLVGLKKLGGTTSNTLTSVEISFGTRLDEFNRSAYGNAEPVSKTAIMRIADSAGTFLRDVSLAREGSGAGSLISAVQEQVPVFLEAITAQGYRPYFKSVTVLSYLNDCASARTTDYAEGMINGVRDVIQSIRSLPWFAGARVMVLAPSHRISDGSVSYPHAKRVRQAVFEACAREGADVLDGYFFDHHGSGQTMQRLGAQGSHDLGIYMANLVKNFGAAPEPEPQEPLDGSGYKVWPGQNDFTGLGSFADSQEGSFGVPELDTRKDRVDVAMRGGRGRAPSIVTTRRRNVLRSISDDLMLRIGPDDPTVENFRDLPSNTLNAAVYLDHRPSRRRIWPKGVGPASSPFDVCFYDGSHLTGVYTGRGEIVRAPQLRSWVRADLVTTVAEKRGLAMTSDFDDLAHQLQGKSSESVKRWTPFGAPIVRRVPELNGHWAFEMNHNASTSWFGDYFRTKEALYPSGTTNGFHVFVAAYRTQLASAGGRYIIGSRNDMAVFDNAKLALRMVQNPSLATLAILEASASSGSADRRVLAVPNLVSDSRVHICEAWFGASTERLIVGQPALNGASAYLSGAGTTPAPSRVTNSHWYVGGTDFYNTANADQFSGYVAEWIIYEGHLSWFQRMAIIAYLWERYGLGLEAV